MAYAIVLPVSGQPNSASLFGKAVKNAINDLDVRISALEAFTTGKPVGRITQGAAQSIPDNVGTAIVFAQADAIDTHNFHDPASNNTRITPTVAGLYRFKGTFYLNGRTDFSARACWFRKNGTTSLPPGDRKGNLVNSLATTLSTELIIDMNGSTDYIEFLGFHDNAANVAVDTVVASQFASHVEWEYVRG